MISLDANALKALIRDAVREAMGERPAPAEKAKLSAAAKARGISPRTIKQWQDGGKLTKYYAGRVRLVDLSELDAFLQAEPVQEESPEALARKASLPLGTRTIGKADHRG